LHGVLERICNQRWVFSALYEISDCALYGHRRKPVDVDNIVTVDLPDPKLDAREPSRSSRRSDELADCREPVTDSMQIRCGSTRGNDGRIDRPADCQPMDADGIDVVLGRRHTSHTVDALSEALDRAGRREAGEHLARDTAL
jgi:hypothetical protein